MSTVRRKDKRIGVTYVYEQEKGVWDPQKKQMRSKRTLIGKIDPETGEVVPTKGWGKNRESVQKKTGRRSDKSPYEEQKKRNIERNQKIAAKDTEIAQLRQELHNLTGQ